MTARTIRSIFFSGLIAVLPAIATIYLVVWLVTGLEAALAPALRYVLPADVYIPGMGLIVGIAMVFVVGLAMQAWLGRELWNLGEKLLQRMPLVSQIFGAVKEVVTYMSGSNQPSSNAVVAITVGEPAIRMLGLVTRETLDFLGSAHEDDQVAVFLPWSYQVGGFTVLVARHQLEPVNLSPREALRLILTAGVSRKAPTP